MIASGLTVLLIEPDPLMADVTGFRLELLGYRVVLATTTVEAWSAIDRRIPHLIILELDADDFDAFALLEQFSSDTKTSEIPVLVLSSDADLDRVERAWKSGACDYLVTPYDPRALEQKVARRLDGLLFQENVLEEDGARNLREGRARTPDTHQEPALEPEPDGLRDCESQPAAAGDSAAGQAAAGEAAAAEAAAGEAAAGEPAAVSEETAVPGDIETDSDAGGPCESF